MKRRTTFVLIVMKLAVLAALFPAAPGEPVLMAAAQDSSGAAAARSSNPVRLR